MLACIVVTARRTLSRCAHMDIILRRLGYELRLVDELARLAFGDEDILLVDTRHATKEFFNRLSAWTGPRRPSCVIAIVDEQQRTAHRLALLEAGVDVVLPWDVARLETQLAIALEDFIRRAT